MPRIYLDNAATTWPKPEAVYRAVDSFVRENGAAPGRGAYREALAAGQIVERARVGVARLIGATDPRRVIFTSNGSDSLNLALHGLLQPGDHVVTTVLEHNSVLRPLEDARRRIGVTFNYIGCDAAGRVDPADIAAAIKPQTRLVAVNHASNVIGVLQPLDPLAEVAHRGGALLLVDAAQSLGQVVIDVTRSKIDLLAAPGHKGLFGLMGTGVLYIRPGLETQLQNRKQGGTGTSSEQLRHPETMPERYETGIANAPGLAGLAAGVEYVVQQGVEVIHQRVRGLADRLQQGLSEVRGVRVYGDPSVDRTGVVSFTLQGMDPHEVAALLDAAHSIAARAGLHCAPLAHRALGTHEQGGTVRLSCSALTRDEEISATLEAVRSMAQATANA